MKVREIKIRNFKRFTDTTITDIPVAARLVLLVGPNGSGKSSLIDAFHMYYRMHWLQRGNWDETYHRKQMPGAVGERQDLVTLAFHDPQPANDEQRKRAIYTRSAYRNDPEFGERYILGVLARRKKRKTHFVRLLQSITLKFFRFYRKKFSNLFEGLPTLCL